MVEKHALRSVQTSSDLHFLGVTIGTVNRITIFFYDGGISIVVCSFTKHNMFQDVQLSHARLQLSMQDSREQGRAWLGSAEKQQVSSAVGNSPCNLGKKEEAALRQPGGKL